MLNTPRLLLRRPLLIDLDRWADMMAIEEAARFVGGLMTPPIAWRSLMTQAGAWTLTGVAMFSVIEKSTRRWVGRVGPWQPLGWPGTEVGWALHPDAWGNGYAVEAARASMDYAFTTLGWTDIIHCIHPDNTPSQRVAERLGSTNRGRGTLPAPFEDDPVDIWGQTKEQWYARNT